MLRLILVLIFFGLGACASKIPFSKIPDSVVLSGKEGYFSHNPYGNAPLSAELRLAKKHNEPITITVKGQDGALSDLSYTWEANSRTVFPISGLYFDASNTIIISTPTTSKELVLVVTNKPSSMIKNIEVLVNNRSDSEERRSFLNFFNPVSKLTDLFAVDNFGKIRWYQTADRELHAMKFYQENGEIIFSVLNTKSPQVLYYNITGKLIRKIDVKDIPKHNVSEADLRFHHDMYSLKNGNIIILDKSQYGVEDVIIEISPQGKIEREILLGDWIRKSIHGDSKNYTGVELFTFDSEKNPFDEFKSSERYPGMPPLHNAIDWAHLNAVSFNEDNDEIILSSRQHGIFSFTYSTGTLRWILSRSHYEIPVQNKIFYNMPEDMQYTYQIAGLKPFLILQDNAPDHTHAVTSIGSNTYFVFDNSGNDGLNPQEGSRMLVFSVDTNTKSMTVDWEYRHKNTNGSYLYSQIVSDMDQTPFHSYISVFGTQNPFTFIEISEDKKIIFEMKLDIQASGAGNSSVSLPIACPTSRLAQNGVFIYRSDYQSIYPTTLSSID